ncbi:E3 ubiquitin-protein ligase RKP [Arachis stenosperma]|uniref:E3 ubiquitin-protein ligase RKP n=1 Tax=Arachis stenosperma TaxID=217475 RepID=UPI0025AD8E92|nr:E3 ubiquitin-protein ligase RKP [Arachis stenosperma]XP_057749274.1 E3 ubiquitin-protein ligase RKP [Arachis stenosperma]
MGEEGLRLGGFSAGLAVILNDEDKKDNSSKTRLLSCCDDLGHESVERTLEYVFGLPNRSLNPVTDPIDSNFIRSIIRNEFSRFNAKSRDSCGERDGIFIAGGGSGIVGLESSSICGDITIIKLPLLVESLANFSSARANVCVWKGKWMYEVILETSGIQQLGWATISCPFTDHKGVGDADDSYAYDGKRVSKWNKDAETYGQSWVVGDVIGCCVDLECDEILFFRNGNPLGVAFRGIRKMGPGFGYYPAISLSQGERCELNFGGRPFKFPIEGYCPLQAPPCKTYFVSRLLECWSRLLDMHSVERSEYSLVQKLRRVKRFLSLEEFFHPVSHAIAREFFYELDADAGNKEYMVWGPVLSFLFDVFRLPAPHDYSSLDKVVDVLLQFQGSHLLFENIIDALSGGCKIAPLVLTECPYSGSYAHLALACHLLRREELMVLWWKSPEFEFMFEGFLSQKAPNKHDLESLIPTVWWPGSCEDATYADNMMLTTTALSESISKIEEKHRDLCRLVIQFIPPSTPPQLPGSVFRTFLQSLLLRNRGADRNVPPPGVSSNSVLVSTYSVILHFLSEGFELGDICGWLKGCKSDTGFLHRGGEQSFPVSLLVKNDPLKTDISRLGGSYSHLSKVHPVIDYEMEVVRWDEGCMDDEETRVTHSSRQKPCCCSSYDSDFSRNLKDPAKYRAKGSRGHCSSIPERSAHVTAECSEGSLEDEITDKSASSDQSEPEYGYRQMHHTKTVSKDIDMPTAALLEEELLDVLLWLYHVGLASNFKQASYYMTHQAQSILLLEETDKQIREGACSGQLKLLKEARNEYREEVIDCVRHCAWFRISLFARWKQRGMFALCMWVVQLLLVLSNMDSVFVYVPEYYLEALVDCFHVLRKSDPPLAPSTSFIKRGLNSFVTFVVTHFNDPRISSADLRDLLLQSISVLVQYREYLTAFESNEAATHRMPKALLSAFDNRSWIPVTNILLRLCKGSGFGFSKNGESSSSSFLFQRLLKEACTNDEGLFSAFLNRLFNTLSWTMTEFSVSVREMQEKYQVVEFQQRKCSVIFDLSCNLARILEFCTREIPQAFLSGPETNLRRLTELIVFILNNIISAADAEFFDMSVRRNGQSPEKVNRGMILAPLVGMILNLLDATNLAEFQENNYLVDVFASMDCPNTVHYGFQYLLDFNWDGSSSGDAYAAKYEPLENFLSLLTCRIVEQLEKVDCVGETDAEDRICCICVTYEVDALIEPCLHKCCYGCITRHLLNCQRCFFCNTTVTSVRRMDEKTG